MDGSSLNTDFGESLAMSKDGTTLIIGAPGVDSGIQTDAGAVYYYKWNVDGSTNTYTLQQTINAPDTEVNMRFGSQLDLNQDGTRLIISSENASNSREMKFDAGETTFDLQDTTVIDVNKNSGSVYTATMYDSLFVIDDRLITNNVSENDDFGKGVHVIDNSVFVGAPNDDGNTAADGSTKIVNDGTVASYDLKVAGEYAWRNAVTETPLIDIKKLGQTFDFSKSTKEIRDFYELYDPIKGRILGAADREINIKSAWDPAQYNTGVGADPKLAWAEDHVGEVWWDLRTVKWLWYEQDSQEYKVNNWGKTFPGSSIDIYEWIESPLLPSEYAAASASGNTDFTGTPLKSDDSAYTVCLLYTSPSPRDLSTSRMPSSA